MARALRQRKTRDGSRRFLVEGIRHVGEAIEAGWEIDAILYAPESLKSNFGREVLARSSCRQEPVSVEVMEYLAEKDNPQGILAVVQQRNASINSLGDIRRAAALIAPQDPGNVGTILRTLDAVDGDALFLLDGGVDPYHPSAVRASMGTLFWKPVVETSFTAFQTWRQQRRFQLIGTSAHGEQDYRLWTPSAPWILLLGSEQKGLNPNQMRACDVMLSLPMRGRATSLNLAVAAGILLYHFV